MVRRLATTENKQQENYLDWARIESKKVPATIKWVMYFGVEANCCLLVLCFLHRWSFPASLDCSSRL